MRDQYDLKRVDGEILVTYGKFSALLRELDEELGGGVRVIWGSAEQSELKAQILTRLMAGDHRVYDVSAPSTPTVR